MLSGTSPKPQQSGLLPLQSMITDHCELCTRMWNVIMFVMKTQHYSDQHEMVGKYVSICIERESENVVSYTSEARVRASV